MHLHRMNVGQRLIDMAKKRRPWADKPPIRGAEFDESRVMESAESQLLSLLSEGQSGMPLQEFLWRSVKYDGFGINGPRKLRLTGEVPSPEDCARFKVKDAARQAAWDAVGNDWRCAGCGRSKCETLRWSKSKTWSAGLFCDHDSQRGSAERLYRCQDCNIVPSRFRDWLKITSTPDPWESTTLESRAATNKLLHAVITVRDHEMHEIDFKKMLELMQAANHGHIGPDSLFVQDQLYWRPPANKYPDLFD